MSVSVKSEMIEKSEICVLRMGWDYGVLRY